MKVIINPQFDGIKDFVYSVPSIFATEGEMLYDGARNKLKVFDVQGLSINVKSYRVPIFINRIIYTFFRKSKAERSYRYAMHLLSEEVLTPAPVAYIEMKQGGLLSKSYYISLHTPMQGNLRILDYENEEMESSEKCAISAAFGKYTAQLHKKGILHTDYSPGNILYEKEADGSYRFSLVDINRMRFGTVPKMMGLRNFSRLWGDSKVFEEMGKAYAQEMGYDPKECCDEIIKCNTEFFERRDRKRKFWKKVKFWA